MSTTRRSVRDLVLSGRLFCVLLAAGVAIILLQRVPMRPFWSHTSAAAEVLIGVMLVVTGIAGLLHRL